MAGVHDDVRAEPLAADFPSASDKAVCWKSLSEDSGCAVALFDDQGAYLFANELAIMCASQEIEQVRGRKFTDLFPAPFAQERLEVMRRTLQSGKPHMVIGMVRGSWNRMTLRRVRRPDDHSDYCVLTVCRPVLSSEQSCFLRSVPPQIGDCTVIRAKAHDKGVLDKLSERELEVLRFIGEGLSTSAIAAQLHRSSKTVEWHRLSLGRKLGVANRVELARISIAAGLHAMEEDEFQQLAKQRRFKSTKNEDEPQD